MVSEAVKVNVFILSLEATLCSAEMTAGPLWLVLKMQWEQERKQFLIIAVHNQYFQKVVIDAY